MIAMTCCKETRNISTNTMTRQSKEAHTHSRTQAHTQAPAYQRHGAHSDGTVDSPCMRVAAARRYSAAATTRRGEALTSSCRPPPPGLPAGPSGRKTQWRAEREKGCTPVRDKYISKELPCAGGSKRNNAAFSFVYLFR